MAISRPGMRRRRQEISASDWTNSDSSRPTGCNSFSYRAMWRWYSAASSAERRTVAPVSAVLTAFKEDWRLPSSLRGPVLRRAFARVAARRLGEIARVSSLRAGSAGVADDAACRARAALLESLRALRSAARRMERAVMGFCLRKKKWPARQDGPAASLPERSTQGRENEPWVFGN